MDYSLNISFTNDQLSTLFATGSNVIIAKPSSSSSSPNVAWLSFKPFQANNVTWEENYGIYVSTQAIEAGATLTQLSNVPDPAAQDKLYTLQASGVISGPADGGRAGSFALLNQYTNLPYMTVGLYQDATVNGTQILNHAISAVPVLLQSTALMTPFTTVYIWLQSDVEGNCVITDVTSPMTQLEFGGSVTDISVAYDSATGLFIAAS